MMREVLTRRFKRLMRGSAARGDRVDARQLRTLVPCGRGWRPTGRAGDDGRCERLADPSPASLRSSTLSRKAERAMERGEAIETTDDADSPWPDLVLIDGGQGQLTAARETLAALGVTDVPLVGDRQGAGARCRPRDLLHARAASRSSSSRAIRCSISCSGCATRRIASRSARTAHAAQEGHPRGRPAGDPRHRPDPQARAAAALRHAEGDRARLARRSRTGARHQRRNRAQDLRFLPRNRAG